MNNHFYSEKINYLSQWFRQPQGQQIATAFASELQPFKNQLQGTYLIQLGLGGSYPWLAGLKYRFKWFVSPNQNNKYTHIYSDLQSLPIERHSIDCIIAPMIIETLNQPMSLIEEIDRILKPMGYVIFLGINPISFWGLAHKINYLNCFGDHPVTLTSSLTIKHCLLNRGFQHCALNSFYFIPPLKSTKFIKYLNFLNPMGKMIWPFPAGFYCLVMQKFETLTPLVTPFIHEKKFVTELF